MNRHFFSRLAALAVVVTLTAPFNAEACSSCGCNLGTEWADTGYSTASGLRIDLRYDFVNQDQLRYGSHGVDRGSLEIPNEDEIQQGTLTRFYTLGLDYSINRDWGISLQLPYLQREHQTIAEGDSDVSASSTRGIGDLRIVARYQGFFEDRSWGVQLGLKLPTGKIDDTFGNGSQTGEIIDRGLQNGSGTTDLIAGIYHYAALSRDWDRFEQLQIKQALDMHDQFRPSTQISANAGLRYLGFAGTLARLVPQLQINGRVEGRESGEQADYPNSGSQVVDLSPGLSASFGRGISIFSFVQLPVYQHYTGYQLAPHYTVSVNLGYRF